MSQLTSPGVLVRIHVYDNIFESKRGDYRWTREATGIRVYLMGIAGNRDEEKKARKVAWQEVSRSGKRSSESASQTGQYHICLV